MTLLLAIAGGLVVWFVVAVVVAVVLGRMCARRDEQVCTRDRHLESVTSGR